MGDVLMVLVIVAFFVCSVGYVGLCDRIIGPDVDAESVGDGRPGDAPAEELGVAAWIATSASDNWIGLGLSVLIIAYLVMVLVFPERF